jgi:hypothetical protein
MSEDTWFALKLALVVGLLTFCLIFGIGLLVIS